MDRNFPKEQQTLSEKSSPLAQAAHRSARGMSLNLTWTPYIFIYGGGDPEGPSLQEQSKEPRRHENGHHTVLTDDHDWHMWTGDPWDGKARQPLYAPKRWPLRAGFVVCDIVPISRVSSKDDSWTQLYCSVIVLKTLASLYDLSSLIYEKMKSWHPLCSTRYL